MWKWIKLLNEHFKKTSLPNMIHSKVHDMCRLPWSVSRLKIAVALSNHYMNLSNHYMNLSNHYRNLSKHYRNFLTMSFQTTVLINLSTHQSHTAHIDSEPHTIITYLINVVFLVYVHSCIKLSQILWFLDKKFWVLTSAIWWRLTDSAFPDNIFLSPD